eukprot:scaffold36249_cov60-Phaeocystis_antarctica.AAC.1
MCKHVGREAPVRRRAVSRCREGRSGERRLCACACAGAGAGAGAEAEAGAERGGIEHEGCRLQVPLATAEPAAGRDAGRDRSRDYETG